jgi:alternate signal-mediated exported protein
MKKSTKGAIATGAAAVLLLGGAGTLAYWSATEVVDGDTITAGDLALATPDCGDWTLDSDEDAPDVVFDPTTDQVVPGDVITSSCVVQFTAVGEHLRATIEATPGVNSTNLFATGELTLDVGDLGYADTDTGPFTTATELTEDNNEDYIEVPLTITFSAAADDVANQGNVQSVLDDITLSAEQVHD